MSTTVTDATTTVGEVNRTAAKTPGQFLQWIMVLLLFATMTAEAVLDHNLARNWLVCVGLLIAFVGSLGLWIMGDVCGIFISNRNVISMSRTQLTLWTLVIFPAVFVLAAQRAVSGVSDPLGIGIPAEVWGVLGISLGSLVGTPLLLQQKTDEVPSNKALVKTQTALDQPAQQIASQSLGTLFANPSPSDARISDMFQGDEVGNKGYIDPAKIQMFVLTVVLVLVYAVCLWKMFSGLKVSPESGAMTLPALSQSQIALLGISHAGYLTSKAVSHTDQE